MRVIYDNLADWCWIEASAPYFEQTLPVTNLAKQAREKIARTVTSGISDIMLTMAPKDQFIIPESPQAISAVVLYRGTFTASDTWRVQIYEDSTQAVEVYDSGWVTASAPKTLGDLNFGIDPLGLTLFSDWGYTFSALWFPTVFGSFVRISFSTAETFDLSRLFIGDYWEPSGMPTAGMSLGWRDTSSQFRTEGGTLHSEAGAMYRGCTINGLNMSESDRFHIEKILRNAGLRKDVYLSIFPGLLTNYERDHQMQAKLVATPAWTIPVYAMTNQNLVFEEV